MGGFDTLALGSKILFGDNWFSDFNAALHESSIYNITQTTIASVAVFTGGMNSGFNKAANSAGVKPSCFVAGTLVMAVAGMVAIETIKSGDKVISTDPETFETAEKTVLETYIREVNKLVHLTINGEEIITTFDHPFYVRERGFVNACELWVGAQLLDVNNNILVVGNTRLELAKNPVKVYNFQVEDYHTYYVGENGVWVHNANCKLIKNDDGTYDAELSYKEDWTPEQRAEADAKCKALSDADTVKTKVERNDSPSVEYKKAFGKDSIPAGKDIDHTIDLQLGGNPDVKVNGKPLDKSVNRSLGKQIGYLIKDFDYGTIIRKFTMVNRQ